ncbi:cytochrome B [Paramagnetospirillum kuznetsovii]|uniref:Cytochrome B n=1 Tax=Paramagnetospirillum kuznetsovii TaxID=2053833 RepID=A0A364P2L4_9PROT|nr:cytochrome b [Paramagnetospirillum kuznetsovii]RAU23387.1 cytochrome B [Paramagnetospirillum kuznetsovii]
MSEHTRYDRVAMGLHWLMALAIIGLMVAGFIMTGLKPGSAQQFQMYQMHKSVGATVLVLTLLRLFWRLGHRPPPLPDHMPEWEKLLAHAGHLGLYALMLAMPLAGWAVVSTSPYNIPTVLYGLIPVPHLPLPRGFNDGAKLLHEAGAWMMILAVLGHVGAALRHHFLIKDDVLIRMLPRFRRSP